MGGYSERENFKYSLLLKLYKLQPQTAVKINRF